MNPRGAAFRESRKILVVDDDEKVREMLSDYLQLHDFEVRSAKDGLSAMDLMSLDKQRFDVIITDYHMPGMGGIELIKKVRHCSSLETIIGMSGFGATETEFMSAGANAFLLKPFDLHEILSEIDAAAEKGVEKA